nr:LCP family protein [Paenibacillus radicis (ex Xue et al. 2023)]
MARKLKWSLLSVVILLLGVLGYYTYAFVNFSNKIQSKPEGSKFFNTLSTHSLSKTSETFTPPKWEGKQRVNVLLLGGDSRGMKKNEVPRSDTLIVASIDPTTKKAYLFSILRDTYVKIPGSGEDRINAALALGGPNLAMKTVGDFLGIPVQYYVYTDFKGFMALVDAIDGIDIDVEKNMKYSDSEDGHEYDINLKKGMQHLDGKMALQYVRFRHDALSDFARTERQRNFMQAVAQKMQSTSSIIKLPKILSSIDPYIETNLTTTDMLKLGSLGYEAKTEGMVSQQIPPSELLIEKRVGSAEVISVNRDKLQTYIQALFNGSAPSAAAAGAKESMKSSGPATVTPSSSTGIKSNAPNAPPAANTKSTGAGTVPNTGLKTGTAGTTPLTGAKLDVPVPASKPISSSSAVPDSKPAANDKSSSGASSTPTAGEKTIGTGAASANDSKSNGPTSSPAPAEKTIGTGAASANDSKNNGPSNAPNTGAKPGEVTTIPSTDGKQDKAITTPANGAKPNATSSTPTP